MQNKTKQKKILNYINKQKKKQYQKTKHAYIHRTKTKTNLSWLPVVFVAMLLAVALSETKECVHRASRGYKSVLVFYSGWAGLCLAQGPNLNFRLLVLFLLFYVSLKKKKNCNLHKFSKNVHNSAY